ncbi:MAG: MopE-related protein [Flavobacteriales bacterium]
MNTFVSWDATNLYVAVEGANLAQAHVFYIDRNPVIPVNGGVNSDGTNVGFNYDGASFAELPFRADAVMFVKNDYREFRTANGANGWSSQTSAFGAYGENAGTSTREYSISWANLGGFPVGGFNFFCFNVQTGPNVYNTQPTENPGGNIGTGARYSRYFTVTDATVGSGTPPFSRNSYVFTGTGNINNFGAISVWDFTMNTSSLQIARSNAGGNWTIGGTLRVNNGTVFFGSGGSGYGTTNVANVAITGSGSLNMDQTNQALNISGNLVQTGGTFFLSGTVGGDVVIQGNWTRDGGTFTNNARAVTFNSTGAQAIGGTATTDFGFLTINKATGALTLNRSANVNNLLTLTSGIVNTSATNILTITNTGAGSVSGGSGTSHINGPLVRNLPANLVSSSTYNFPVGKGGNYYPYTLTNPTSGASAPAITVEAFNTNAGGTAGVGISALSTTEHWSASFTGNYTGGSVSLARPTALGTLNVIGRSATVNGTYAKLNGTVSGTSVINSDNTGASLGFFTFGVNVPAPTITSLGSTSGCPGDQLVINGTNLTGAIAANTTIGGTPVASIVSNTGTVLTVVVGAGTTGSVAVTIAGQTGTSGTSYTVNPTPANPGNPTSDSPQCATPGVTLTRTGTPPGGETWYWQTSATGTSTANSGATFNVTTSGTYYIRAQGAGGCWSLGAGSVTVVVNNAPAAATTPTPANNATNVCYAGGGVVNSVSWTAVAGATSYDVYFGAGSLPGSVTSNVATNTYSTGTLSASTTYFWQVVAKNACGDAVGSATWQFTTAASACGLTYCTPTYSSAGTNDLITQVTLGTLSQATASNPNPHYINYTTTQNAIPNLSQQGTFNLSLTFGSDPDQFSGVWVDFDQSATFDASEFFAGANPGANGTVIIPITVPAGATLGLTTMRIRGGEDDAVINSEACGASSSTFGQAQDYLVNIIVTQPTLFATPSGLSFGNIQNGSTSTEQTFGLSAIALSPAAGNLTVTAPTGYQVSLTSGSGFAGSVSVPYSGGALSSTTIYVIFSPNAADQLFSGNIVCSGGGAANNVNVAVTGNSYTTASFLFDNFNRADNNTVGIPSSGGSTAWTETEIGGDPFRARIESNTLQLHACSGVSGTTGGTGAEYVSFDASSIYPTTYSSANTTLTWEFNMRSNNNSPSGFDSNTYGTAFILGSDEANFRSTTADGYAVVIGNSGATDPVRLVRFANGMLLNSNITTIIASSSTTADAYYSVRVSLNTCTNTWSLQVRNDLGAFANPNTGTYNAPSTQVDNAHTSKNLRYFGAYWQHSSACSNISNFDNFYVPTGARPVVGPITGTASACAGTTGLTYSIPAVTGATTYAWTVPTGWNITAGGTTNSITVTAGAAGENGNISVTASNTCGSLGTSSPFAVTALPNNPVSVSIAADPVSPICAGTEVTFTATPTNPGTTPTYAWTVNGSPAGTNSATFVTSSLTNNSNVQVTLTSNISCPTGNPAASNVINFTVNPIVTPSVSIAAAPSNNVCAGDLVTFTATPTNGGTTPSYAWTVNGNSVGTNSNTFSSSSLVTGDIVSVEMTSNAICTSTNTALSNNITMTVNALTIPSVTIAANTPSPICAGTSVTFTATPTNGGVVPTYAWFINATPAGTNSATFTTTALVNGDIVSVQMTSNAVCPSPTTATSNSLTYTVTAPPTWYQDVDNDGYTSGVTQVSCTQPIGYRLGTALVSLVLVDCNDNNDDINPGQEEFCNGIDDDCDTFIDEGLLNLTYYRDLDGDGFGNPLVTQVACALPTGFVLNNTDCNDNNASVNPNGTEACNGIDDDCDTVVDEGCGVINDEPFTGIIAIVAPYQVCTNQVGTLAGASASAQAQTICPTGEDVWYYFTASSTAISVLCNTTINDVVIELQTDAGALLASENATSGIGNERLNYFGLTPGETYFIAIRNFNSALGAGGSFQLCVQRVLSSTCDISSSPTNRINPCNSFKADYTAANQYIFHFDPTVNTTASTITYTLGMTSAPANPWISLASVPGIQYGEVYDVTIDAVYQLPFGNSQVEMLTVTGAQVCQLYIANQPSMSLRVADSCPNTKLRNAIVRAEPRICSNVVDYEWEFTQVLPTPGLAQTHLRGMNDRNLRLSSVPFLQNGGTYDVRIRPIFAGNVPGSWSTVSSCLRIAGAANIGVSKGEEEAVNLDRRNSIVEFNETFEFSVYPNPNSGDAVQLNINGINQENVTVQITDALGKRIYENKFYIESDQFYTVVEFNNSLTAGLYFIELVTEGRVREVKKLVVQK